MFFGKTRSTFRWRRTVGVDSGARQFSHVGDGGFEWDRERIERGSLDLALPGSGKRSLLHRCGEALR
jgi:hypothetical protein